MPLRTKTDSEHLWIRLLSWLGVYFPKRYFEFFVRRIFSNRLRAALRPDQIIKFPKVLVGGFETVRLSRRELCAVMKEDCIKAREGDHQPKLVFDLNGHGLALASWNREYKHNLTAADIIHADGQPAVIASWLLTSTPIPEKSPTTDLFHDAARTACEHGLSFYLLGGTEAVNKKCAEEMTRIHPGLHIAGRHHGYFGPEEEAAICEQINRSGADVLWVGIGKPAEQAFCVRNRTHLKVGWLVTCGGCFNFVAGIYDRAPRWMQTLGLEWLHRLLSDPVRFGWRYLSTNPIALYLLITRTRSLSAGKKPVS